MTIAVIGANGFIGSRLVETLHLGGQHQVVPVVRRASGLALPARFALDWRIGDALSVPSLTTALRGCDAVIHAALGDPRQIEAMPACLGAAAAAAKVPRVIYLSTASVHGQAPAPGTTEDSPLHTGHAMTYNNAKIRAERSFFRACTEHQLAGFALRPAIVFGPRSRWIADLAGDLRRGRAWLLGRGDGICNTVYVDNLVAAVDRCLVAPADTAGAYLVGDAEQITWDGLYRSVAAALGLDAATIHRSNQVPAFARTGPERISHLVASRPVQAFLPLVPGRLKRLVKRITTALPEPTPGAAAWSLPAAPRPRITAELALLQQCRWQLPSDRAALLLGYQPVVSFRTGLQRSLAWLALAEGRA